MLSPGKLGMLRMCFGLGCFKECISSSSPLHQQPWNIKADRLQFQSCDFSAELVMRKIISKLNVQCFSQIMFNNIEL